MSLHLHNTLTGKKEAFQPMDENRVTMYLCGPTVYNYAHIGNARPAVVFDVLNRLLRLTYPNVVFARNITDIDDKINNFAKETGRSIKSISSEYAKAYNKDLKSLNVSMPDIEPYATHHLGEMIAMIQNGLDVSGVITHRFAMKDFEKGFRVMKSGLSGKVVLDWT